MRLPCLLTALGLLAACPPATLDPIVSAGEGTTAEPGSGTLGVSSATTTAQPTDPGDTSAPTDTGATTTTSDLPGTTGDPVDLLTCAVSGTCNQLDLLLIVDNSGSMGEEQNNLALQFPLLVQRLRTLKDAQGQGVGADVQVMVTTTDVGHPLCAPFNKADYQPAMGAPIDTACSDRLERFSPIAEGTPVPEACTSVCPKGASAVPTDRFIAFDPDTHNILDEDGIGDPAVDALACVAPQGIDGCGMESPLEAMGAPIDTACSDRLERFSPIAEGTPVPEACTSVCPKGASAVPTDRFIAFDPDTHNILDEDGIGDPAVDALACVAPQGIDGCGMESPLEAMRLALDPTAPWNTGDRPFLRPGGVLAIVILTDETDCSAQQLEFFDPGNVDDPAFNQFWEDFPGTPGQKKDPTSAVCWNASMTCLDADDDAIYESCTPEDKGVLFPSAIYTDMLADTFETAGKPVFMLLLTGVPSVTAHAPEAPHGPIAGGVLDLVHRQWTPADILPGDPKTAALKQYEFAIGPGCSNAATGQAIPPGRLQSICGSLDQPGELRCCIESICDPSFAGAIECLADMLAQKLTAD